MFLRGSIYITSNIQVIYDAPLDGTKIINLDEDERTLMDNEAVLGGMCLLPPVEALIAESDGNEPLYDCIYSDHLRAPFQMQFIGAIISFLFKGGKLLLYLPSGYGSSNSTGYKLVDLIYRCYGVHIGMIEEQNPSLANCYYDDSCIPIWLNLIYSAHVISPMDYLYLYPIDAVINNQPVINQLIAELRPYGTTYQEQIDYIMHLHKAVHRNPNVHQVLRRI